MVSVNVGFNVGEVLNLPDVFTVKIILEPFFYVIWLIAEFSLIKYQNGVGLDYSSPDQN
jgi:hypothetical protein